MQEQDNRKTSPFIAELADDVASKIMQSGNPVLMPTDLRKVIKENVPQHVTQRKIIKALIDRGFIEEKLLKSESYKDVERIIVPSLQPTPYHYALSLRRKTYLSHGSAVHLLGLTQQQPRTIYVNKEQSAKPIPQGSLTQESIDRAFSRPQRRSNYVFRIDDTQIVLLSGKATSKAGVIVEESLNVPITSLERTLIDITVRPRYAGGVFQVLQAFMQAIDDINVEKMLKLLRLLDYRYPYHQALGFYLERGGADATALGQFKELGIDFDFYLDYSMGSTEYDESWKVFYPLGI